jgi:hypothetical protein
MPGVESEGPDESKFDNMEVVAAAGGPEAEARRNEMGKWAQSTGAYAEKAAEMNKSEEERAARNGLTEEETRVRLTGENQDIARGLNIGEGKGTSQPVYASPVEEGMRVRTADGRSDKVYRSPAELKKSQEKPKEDAA